MLQLKCGKSTIQTQNYLTNIKRNILIPPAFVFENIAQEAPHSNIIQTLKQLIFRII